MKYWFDNSWHALSQEELDSVEPGQSIQEYATTPVEFRKDALLCELFTSATMRPGRIAPGTRPAEAMPKLSVPSLTEQQKAFAIQNFKAHPVSVIATAMGANPYAVKSFLTTRGYRKGPPPTTMYGNTEIMMIAEQYWAYVGR